MDNPRSDRWMALAGPVFLLLFVLALAVPGDTPGESSTGKAVVEHYAEHSTRNAASVFLLGPAAAALLVFAARFATLVGAAGAARRLFQYGAVVYATAITIVAVLQLGVVTASDHEQENVAQTVNVLNNDAWIPVVVGIAVMMFGAGLAVLRTGVLPSWLGWVAVVVGVASILGPGGFLGFFLAPLWVAVAGGVLFARREAAAV